MAGAGELAGSGRPAPSCGVGDPLLSWVYQPAVRTFRGRLYGDDLSFLQAGLPAVFTSDSSFTRFYPWYHQPDDTADKLDAAALARMGTAVVGGVEALAALPLSRDASATGSPPSASWPGPRRSWLSGSSPCSPASPPPGAVRCWRGWGRPPPPRSSCGGTSSPRCGRWRCRR